MENRWEEKSLSDVYEFRSGLSKPRSEFGFGYPFLTFKDVFYNYFVPDELDELVNSSEKERQACSIKRGDVFLTRTSETMDELGMSCVALKDYKDSTFNGFTKRLRPKSNAKVVPEYAAYFFRSRSFRSKITTMSSLSTRASLNNDMLDRLKISLPSIEVQKGIALLLKSLDDKIELNRCMNETLEEMARAIFKSWFVDFDPVKAKITGKKPAHMDAETAALFPDRFDDETGLPEGWKQEPFGNFLEYSIGGDWGKAERDKEHTEAVAIIRGTDFLTITRGDKEKVPIRFVKPSKLERRRLEEFDLIVEVSGGSPKQPTGRSIIITKNILERFHGEIVPASFCRLFKPIDSHLALKLFFHLDLLYKEGGTWAYQNQSTGISNFQTKYFLQNEKVVLPSKEILKSFFVTVSPMLNKMASNENLILSELRDTLLPKLMSGEIRVKDAEKEVERVL